MRSARVRITSVLACLMLVTCCGLAARPAPARAALAFESGPLPAPPGPPVDDLEPGIGVDGTGTFIIGGDSPSGRGADIWVSDNGGLSYHWAGAPFDSGVQGSNPVNGQDADAAAAPSSNGAGPPNLYATTLYLANSSLAVSHDGGKTWQVDELGGIPSQDRPWLAADGPCTVYLAYQNGDSGPPSREMVSRFNACQTPTLTGIGAVINPVQGPLDPYPIGAFLAGKPTVDNSPRSPYHHRLYIPMGGCETDLPSPMYVPSTDPFDCQFARASISIAVSSDGGQSFAVHRIADSTTHQLQIWPDQLAVDSGGEIYLVWGDNHHVYLNTSTDGGTTWSRSQIVDRPPVLSTALPTVAAGAPGHVDIAWYGAERNGMSGDLSVMGAPGAKGAASWRVYFAKSTDSGRTFEQAPVSQEVQTGIVCTSADACSTANSRGLYDDFGIAISPTTQRASIAYTIDQFATQPQSASTDHEMVGFATELPTAIPTPRVGCPPATGRLRGTTLGPVRLGMTRAQAERAFSRSSTRGHGYMEFFCLTANGIRVGYASPRLEHGLAESQWRAVQGRVVISTTANPHYSLQGVRPGTELASVKSRLELRAPFHVGLNYWYLTPGRQVRGVLKVRNGLIEEIGIADGRLTRTRKAAASFLRSFF